MVILFYLVFLSFLYNDALLPLSKKKKQQPQNQKKKKKSDSRQQNKKIKNRYPLQQTVKKIEPNDAFIKQEKLMKRSHMAPAWNFHR